MALRASILQSGYKFEEMEKRLIPLVKELEEVQKLAYVESEVLDAMVNNPRYSVEEVRRQANLVAGLEDQVRAKAHALYQSLRDDDYYDAPRLRRR